MGKNKHNQIIQLISVFLLLVSGITGAGWTYYINEAKSQKERALENLGGIADLKAKEITSWRGERIADAKVLSSNPFMRDLLRTITLPGEGAGKSLIYRYLDEIAAEYGYENWFIYDSDHKPIISSDGADSKDLHTHPWFFSDSMEEIFFSDLHIEKNGNIDIDLVIPVSLDQRTYLIVFIINPSDFLYPLIQSWPGASQSGETILVEKSGEEILFLNDLRNRKGTAMKLRTPFLKDLPAVKAVSQIALTMEGRDYRGVPVLAATRHVEGSPWGLVTKVDVEEVLSPLKNRLGFVILSCVLLIFASGLAIIFLWQRQRDAISLSEAFKYKDIAAELAETRDRLLEAQQISHLGNWNWDIVSGSLTWSDEVYRIFGLKPQEVSATYGAFLGQVHPEDRQKVIDAVDHAVKNDAPYNIDHRILRPDGSVRLVSEVGKVLRDGSGEALNMTGIVHDVTERKLSEEALLKEKETVQSYFDIAGVIFLVLGRDGTVSRINRMGQQILDYSSDEILGEYWFDRFLPERDREPMKAFFAKIVAGKEKMPKQYENSLLTRLGEERIISWQNIPVYDDEGEIVEVLSSGEDVTKRRRAEEEYKTIITTALDGYWIVDHKASIIDVNDAYCRLTGYSREELLKMRIPDLEIVENLEETAAHMKNIMEKGHDRFETKHRCKDGRVVDIDISTTVVYVGERPRFYVFLRDITEQNLAKKAIIESKDTAEQASRAKSEFLANMSHEIRTPMTSILGMAELLTETKLDEEQQEYIERLRHSGDALIAIINDILDLSKIEAGHVHLEEIEFNLTKELYKVISIFDAKTKKKGIPFVLDIPSSLPATFMGDPVRLRQVLINLLGNAVKFTDSGQIKIAVAYNGCERGEDMCRLHIDIHDTGIGIEAEKLESIFSEFIQADTSTTRLYGGTGLGLTISKKLVSLMGGEISAESEYGKGSIFHITLNMKEGSGTEEEERDAGDKEASPSEGEEKGLKILLAEDAEDNRLLVKAFLKDTPHILDMAENGEEAFERFTANEYDLVLMDMQMPVMDGYEATRIIRKWEGESGLEATPIIAFTAHALKEEVASCMKVGCTGHIAKPVKKKTLLHSIWEYGRNE